MISSTPPLPPRPPLLPCTFETATLQGCDVCICDGGDVRRLLRLMVRGRPIARISIKIQNIPCTTFVVVDVSYLSCIFWILSFYPFVENTVMPLSDWTFPVLHGLRFIFTNPPED